MRFTETFLKGAYIVEPEPVADHRGHFARVLCRDEMKAAGLVGEFVQFNESYNATAGTLRGLHFQKAPHEEVKVVRCTRGALYDVIVDIRPDSPTRYKWVGVELSERNGLSLYVPAGFAHGYMTLEDSTTAFYMVSTAYAPGAEGGLRFDDPKLNIAWPYKTPAVISKKDANWPLL